VDAHPDSFGWGADWAKRALSCQKRCHAKLVPTDAKELENDKSPDMRGLRSGAEEDSNLHPVIPDQGLNLVR
jgi:hypothetical protein